MANAQINLSTLSSEQITELKELLEKKISKLVLTTTYVLSTTEKADILTRLGFLKNAELVVENIVDTNILGGIIVQCEGHYLDFSLRGTLQAISESLSL